MLCKITNTGLAVVDFPLPEGAPTVLQAWQSLINVEVEPVIKIDQEIPDAQERVDHAWFSRASENSLFAAGGEFFISVGGAGSLELGWVCVRWLKGVQMASRLMQGDGNLEFLGMSVSGRYVCGVTTEESDYWVAEKWFE